VFDAAFGALCSHARGPQTCTLAEANFDTFPLKSEI
jgi:hypothetical protein